MPTRMNGDVYGVLASNLQEAVVGTTMEQLSHQDLEIIGRDMMDLLCTRSKAWKGRSREPTGNLKTCSPNYGLATRAAD